MLPGLDDTRNMPGGTQSLYRKYRPVSFDEEELVGQQHVTRTLRNAIRHGRVAHAYLFCGPRGTGKTTTARLLAKAVNCLDDDAERRPCGACASCRAIQSGATTDIIEIDAASNRGIDDIRNLREQVNYAPSQLKSKFYIIDEAHQITKDAFNAFLKTLEEPPPRTTFVLATTDPDKLPDTIASRCQRFDFQRIPREQAVARIRAICDREGIAIDDDALDIVVRRATGSLRDALSLVDMLATAAGQHDDGRIDIDLTRRMLGISDDGWEYDLAQALADHDIASGLKTIARANDAGHDMRSLGRRLQDLLRILLLVKAGANPVEAGERSRALAERFELGQLLHINRQFSDVDFRIRNSGFPQLPLELAFVGSLVEGARVAAGPVAPAPVRDEQPPPRQRGVTAAREASPPASPPERPRGVAPDAAAPPRGSGATPVPPDVIEQVVAQWERIRTEVKATDRKAEALLSSTDPAGVSGDSLFVVAAFPFHANMLNEPRMRTIVEDAVEHVIGARLHVRFVLRNDLPAFAPPEPAPAPARLDPPAAEPPDAEVETVAANGVREDQPSDSGTDEPADDDLLRLAKAIFDAEEIEPDEAVRQR